MRSKNTLQRVSRALIFVLGQIALGFFITTVSLIVDARNLEISYGAMGAVFAVSVYYFGFLIGPITTIVLIIGDNRPWMRTASALIPGAFGVVAYLVTVFDVPEEEPLELVPDGAAQGGVWVLVTVVLFLVYNRLFVMVERAIWR